MTKLRTLRSTLAATTVLLVALTLVGTTQTHIVLMHTNDIHGHLLPENDAGGLAVIAAIVKQQRPDILLFFGKQHGEPMFGDPPER